MPFRHLSPDQFSFDLLKAMQSAFDAGCESLRLDQNDPMRTKLATIIIELASEGTRDHLLERALEKMSQTNKSGISSFQKLRNVLSPSETRREVDPS